MPKFEKGEANPRHRSHLHPGGAEGALDGTPQTPEEVAQAEKDREQLAALVGTPPAAPGGQAPAGAPAFQRPSTLGTDPLPPMPPVDVEAVSKARQAKLDAIAAAGRKARELEVQLEEQQRNAEALAAQIKADRLAMVQERERHEQEAIKLQHELTRADALAQAQALEQSQADRQLLVIDERAARKEQVKAIVRPFVERAQQELERLLSVQGGSAEIFGRAAAFKVPLDLTQIGDGGQLYHALDAACESCHKVNEEISTFIAQCHRALAAAKRIVDLVPPDTADGRLAISRVTTDLGYCKDSAEHCRLRAEGAMSQFASASKAAAPYIKTAKPVRPDVIVSLSGEDREAMRRNMLTRGLPLQQTHAAGMNDPLA
jgi:hypothetical protein